MDIPSDHADEHTKVERRARKHIAYVQYSSESCTGCGWPKASGGWFCVSCDELVKRHRPDQFRMLDEACTAHLDAVDAAISAARSITGRIAFEKVKR